MFNYPKIARNLYRTCMHYVQVINTGIKDIIVYIFEDASLLNSLFGYNESSLADSNDSKQKLYNITKKDEVNFKPTLSGFNLDSSLKDNYYINPKDDILHYSILSGSNTDVLNITATQDGITWVDLNNVAVTTTFLVSATNTEVTGTVATFSGITAIVENLISTLNIITSASNTESSGVSSDNKGITRVPIDTIPYLLFLSGSNTENKELSSDGNNLVRVPIDNTAYILNLTGTNTEPPSLSSNNLGIVRVPIDIIPYLLSLSGTNTEISDLSSDGNNLVRVPKNITASSFLLSSFNSEIINLSSNGNNLVRISIDKTLPSFSLSSFNTKITGTYSLSTGITKPHFEESFPSISLSGINLIYSNLSSGNELIDSKNNQLVEESFPSISLSGINSLNPDFLILPLSYSEPDADAYISLVEIQDGQPLEISIKNAIKEFVNDLKKNNLWGSITDCLILAGARTLNGALVPLKGPAPISTGFNSTNYNRKRLQGNGSGFLNLNRINNNYSLTNHHIAVYKTVSTSSSQYIFGDGFGSSIRPINLFSNGSSQHRNSTVFTPSNAAERNGFFGLVRSLSSRYSIRYNSTDLNSPSRTASNDGNRPLYLFKAGSSTPTTAGISFYSQGTALNLSLYQTLVDRLILQLNSYIV